MLHASRARGPEVMFPWSGDLGVVIDIDGIVAVPAGTSAGGAAVRFGCLELIASMRERGVPVAAAGTGEAESIDRFFRSAGIVGVFDVVVFRDEVSRLPPAPDLLELAAYRMGVVPARCVALWSSTSGLEAARAADMDSWRLARESELPLRTPESHHGPERSFASLSAAREWLVQRVTGESAFAPLAA